MDLQRLESDVERLKEAEGDQIFRETWQTPAYGSYWNGTGVTGGSGCCWGWENQDSVNRKLPFGTPHH